MRACGVCHTEIDEIEGRVSPARLPIVPGHQAVGVVDAVGEGTVARSIGDRVGVGWVFDSCGCCRYCRRGRENLCAAFRATGRDVDGGYAECLVVPEASTYPIPDRFDDVTAAPLLCAGGVGYRSLRLAGIENGQVLGFFGFGASAHIVLQMARHRYPDSSLFVVTRNNSKRVLASRLGADWAGSPDDQPPALMDALIDTTPVWRAVVDGMRMLAPGGRLVINAIGKTDVDKAVLTRIDYRTHLWMEKQLTTVANVTRKDIRNALRIAAEIPIAPVVETHTLAEANRALTDVKEGRREGARVLVVS